MSRRPQPGATASVAGTAEAGARRRYVKQQPAVLCHGCPTTHQLVQRLVVEDVDAAVPQVLREQGWNAYGTDGRR